MKSSTEAVGVLTGWYLSSLHTLMQLSSDITLTVPSNPSYCWEELRSKITALGSSGYSASQSKPRTFPTMSIKARLQMSGGKTASVCLVGSLHISQGCRRNCL